MGRKARRKPMERKQSPATTEAGDSRVNSSKTAGGEVWFQSLESATEWMRSDVTAADMGIEAQ